MNNRVTIAAAVFLTMPFAALNAAAQTSSPATSVTAEMFCDYCEDYTDKATSAGAARSAYSPGSGYAANPEGDLMAATQQRRELARLQALRKRVNSETQ